MTRKDDRRGYRFTPLQAEPAAAMPKSAERGRRPIATAVAAMLLTATGFGCTSSNEPDDTPSVSPPVESEQVYKAVDSLCEAVDANAYERLVGAAPEVLGESRDDDELTDSMFCELGSRHENGRLLEHSIQIRARIHVSEAAATDDYLEGMGLVSEDVAAMDAADGPWAEGVLTPVPNIEEYVLIVRDQNLTLAVVQAVRPFDSLDPEAATSLMRDYAGQTADALRR